MLNLTTIARPYFRMLASRMKSVGDPVSTESAQRRVLASLLRRAVRTAVGERYGFSAVDSYGRFAETVPLVEYEDIRADVMRMVRGEKNILWPGRCTRYAQSSGTSGGKCKFIPITDDALRSNHYAGAAYSVAAYLDQYSESRLFGGKSLILGGSFANELSGVPAGVYVGDLSASLIDCINPAVNLFRVPSKETALMADWTKKLPAIVDASLKQDITNISGVPSWFMTVLRAVLRQAGATSIHDVWPNLEVFFHGGIAFGPYRDQYRAITDTGRMRYQENYNASEGFFAIQDNREIHAMRLLCNIGVFYEFIPLGAPDNAAVPAWSVEPGRIYSLVITGSNGLWRYKIGDTVRVESVAPLRITIAGRTHSFINAFGEEVMEWNTDAAVAAACRRTGAAVANYHAAPVYAVGGQKGCHQWLIEWAAQPACGVDAFADILDAELTAVNSDYQAKRAGGIFLDRLTIVSVPAGTFDRWLASTGKLGGQRKVPRLGNDRAVADNIIEIINKNDIKP